MTFERLREADSIWKKKSLLSIYSHPHRKVTTFGNSFKFQSWTQVNTSGATSPGLWAHGGMHRANPFSLGTVRGLGPSQAGKTAPGLLLLSFPLLPIAVLKPSPRFSASSSLTPALLRHGEKLSGGAIDPRAALTA